ncbi:MAG: hypothetical protein FWD64_00450 [Acidobacteriaceae bacterium]|nr:hypothetical protein [Acidobacteriaceae bacterium]
MSRAYIYALGQSFFFEREADLIGLHVGKIAQSVKHSERKQNGSIGSSRDAGVTFLHFHQSGSGDKGPLSHDSDRNAAAKSRTPDVAPQLTQGGLYRDW